MEYAVGLVILLAVVVGVVYLSKRNGSAGTSSGGQGGAKPGDNENTNQH